MAAMLLLEGRPIRVIRLCSRFRRTEVQTSF
jgi:hypothetical protein